jgi:transcriptional regulator with GAF, ATPase, and Fis domain
VQHEALAHERLAHVWRARGLDAEARTAIAEAHRAYAVWGATAKTADIERRYGITGVPTPSRAATGSADTSPTLPAVSSSIDMATVVKLAHSIAVEVRVGSLIETLMSLVLENAGADRGAFLLERDGRLVVVATATADPPVVRVDRTMALDESPDIAPSVVRYVHRTRQDVALGVPGADDRFAGDPRIATGRARSILCVPVLHRERLGGVLYLENGLTSHAFSEMRTEVTRIIAAQAAISLENAQLYEQMREEVERRTHAEQALRVALGELQQLKERLEAENVYLQEEIRTQHNFNEIIGNSPALLEALRKVERVAPTEATVLIAGETGSGADGGTIFLDEIGELPPEAQVKLLRVLQEQEFEPVGSSRTIRVSVRVIAATNRNLDQAVCEGTFRADLLYRLNVFPIEVPPLRQRGTDIELLASFFLAGLARRLGKSIQGFSVRTMQRMTSYLWPGNVRELQNVIERAAILAQGPVVEVDDALFTTAVGGPAHETTEVDTLDAAQRAHILKVLAMTGGVVEGTKGAAAILGLHANTLRSRMKKLGIVTGLRGADRAH